IDACVDYTRPALTIDIESISKYLADIKAKSGIRLRELAEITAENISSWKQIGTLVDELLHLDGIKGSFDISEGKFLASTIFREEGIAASQMIYFNVRELVEPQQYIFDTLWNNQYHLKKKSRQLKMESSHTLQKSFRTPINSKN